MCLRVLGVLAIVCFCVFVCPPPLCAYLLLPLVFSRFFFLMPFVSASG
jgi:hypothetical protein